MILVISPSNVALYDLTLIIKQGFKVGLVHEWLLAQKVGYFNGPIGSTKVYRLSDQSRD